jgi:isopentenyl diphosphate isomerase/L-lactate dehydrogenase-like FMN-dependent dehydrogenase
MRIIDIAKRAEQVIEKYSAEIQAVHDGYKQELAQGRPDAEVQEAFKADWTKFQNESLPKARAEIIGMLAHLLTQRIWNAYPTCLKMSYCQDGDKIGLTLDNLGLDEMILMVMTCQLSDTKPSIINNVSVPPTPPPKPVEVVRGADGQIVGLNPLA